jgi:hypothetical protein
MGIRVDLSRQVHLAIVDPGKSPALVVANIRQSPDAAFRLQMGLGQSKSVRFMNGTGSSKFVSWVTARKTGDVVISVPGQRPFHLSNCKPTHYKGPTLSSKGSDTEIEELVLSAEHISLDP